MRYLIWLHWYSHQSPSRWKKKHLNTYRMLDSLIPVDFLIISTCPITHCMPGTLRSLLAWKFWVYDSPQLQTSFLREREKKQPIISPIIVSLPPDEYFWNLIYFCKTRQNWNIPQATNNSMHIIAFFPPLKVVFFLGQNLIEKPRFLWITRRQIIIAHTFRASKHLNQESI